MQLFVLRYTIARPTIFLPPSKDHRHRDVQVSGDTQSNKITYMTIISKDEMSLYGLAMDGTSGNRHK